MPTYHLNRSPMTILAYKDSDFQEISKWFSKRGKVVIEECLPQFGFIAPGVAAGFLVQTDCKVCFLEPFVSNPDATREQKTTAFNLIMFNLINLAKLMEFKYIFGVSSIPKMVDLCLDHGFSIQDTSTVLVRTI